MRLPGPFVGLHRIGFGSGFVLVGAGPVAESRDGPTAVLSVQTRSALALPRRLVVSGLQVRDFGPCLYEATVTVTGLYATLETRAFVRRVV
jgi:hypothetical protein